MISTLWNILTNKVWCCYLNFASVSDIEDGSFDPLKTIKLGKIIYTSTYTNMTNIESDGEVVSIPDYLVVYTSFSKEKAILKMHQLNSFANLLCMVCTLSVNSGERTKLIEELSIKNANRIKDLYNKYNKQHTALTQALGVLLLLSKEVKGKANGKKHSKS